MTLIVLPDIEAVLVAYLRARPEVSAIVDDRVATEIPAAERLADGDVLFPRVKLARVGGTPTIDRPLWLDRALVQFDAYGTSKSQARLLADTVRAVMADATGVRGDAVITRVNPGGLMWLPDTAYGEAGQPRYLATAAVSFHPRPAQEG